MARLEPGQDTPPALVIIVLDSWSCEPSTVTSTRATIGPYAPEMDGSLQHPTSEALVISTNRPGVQSTHCTNSGRVTSISEGARCDLLLLSLSQDR
jgi:hypothetical protein